MRLWPSSSEAATAWSLHGLSVQLAGMALLAVLHSFFLPPIAGAGLLALLTWRWLAARQKVLLPPSWLLLVLAVLGSLGVLLWFHTLLGTEAGVALVMWLAGCKALETRTPRDAAGFNLLGLFLSFALILQRQDLPMAVVVVGLIWLFTMSLAADLLPTTLRATARRSAALLMLQAVPLMLILFVAFPRLPGPLWKLPDTRPRFSSGVSPVVKPGSVSNLVQSAAIAMRVRFSGTVPGEPDLYWRGPVMGQFDGVGFAVKPEPRSMLIAPGSGTRIDYEVTIEPHPMRWIYTLDRPVGLPNGLYSLTDGQVVSPEETPERRLYRLSSRLATDWPAELGAEDRKVYLALAGTGNPRARAWGSQLRARYPRAEQRISAVLHAFATGDYYYSLQPPPLPANWIDAFLFQTRRGFCEHYAASAAFVLRAAGVPTRVVGGYLGGEINPVDGYMVVRQSDAHAWMESWIDGRGWVRVDPTGVVVPDRLTGGLADALPAEEANELPAINHPLLRQLRNVWESGQNRWNQWVISYDNDRRQDLLRKLGGNASLVGTTLILIGGGIASSLLAVWLVLWWRGRHVERAAEQREWLKLQRWLARRGLPRDAAEGPRAYLQRVMRARPEWQPVLQAFADLYLRLRYGHPQPHDSAAGLRRLRTQIKLQRSG